MGGFVNTAQPRIQSVNNTNERILTNPTNIINRTWLSRNGSTKLITGLNVLVVESLRRSREREVSQRSAISASSQKLLSLRMRLGRDRCGKPRAFRTLSRNFRG
jgi:hypothetical protein